MLFLSTGIAACFVYLVFDAQAACLYRLVVEIENKHENGLPVNWIAQYGVDPHDTVACYIAALYWAVMTIATVGYGDVVRCSFDKYNACCCGRI